MRRLVLFALILALPGCTGFADFLGETSTRQNPNAPVGESENMRRAWGRESVVEPLTPEPGNVWPGPVQPTPTLQDIEQQPTPNLEPLSPNGPALPDHRQPRPVTPPGSSTPPMSNQEGLPPSPGPGAIPSLDTSSPARSPSGQVTVPLAPGGTQGVITGGNRGYQTLTTPQGQGVVVPNGNGTSTVIRPDGTVTTIPTPR